MQASIGLILLLRIAIFVRPNLKQIIDLVLRYSSSTNFFEQIFRLNFGQTSQFNDFFVKFEVAWRLQRMLRGHQNAQGAYSIQHDREEHLQFWFLHFYQILGIIDHKKDISFYYWHLSQDFFENFHWFLVFLAG